MKDSDEKITTGIWYEEPEPDDPFTAATCYCHGYDVYGDILEKANYIDYLYLMFKGERPSKTQKEILEKVAMVLAHPGVRDNSVRAAMNGGAGGSQNAACLIAALGVGAGQYGGAHEVAKATALLSSNGMEMSNWQQTINNLNSSELDGADEEDIWQSIDHLPGFDPNAVSCGTPVKQTLKLISHLEEKGMVFWIYKNRENLEKLAGNPVSMVLVISAALFDIGFNSDEAEMLFLILRLPGAAVQVLEMIGKGYRTYPFHHDALHVLDDPNQIN